MSVEFKKAMRDLMNQMGIEPSKGPEDDPNRQIYLDYLKEKRLSEDKIAPLIDRDKLDPEVHAQLFLAFISAMKQEDKENLPAILSMMENIVSGNNTNHLIYKLARDLATGLSSAGVQIPSFFAGVFPTGAINAHCVIRKNVPLVLLDTGCFEMIEAAIGTLLSERNETEQQN